MAESDAQLGTITRTSGMYEARLERFLEHDQAAVWSMLTDPACLPQWLAPGELTPRKGGAAKLNFPESGTVIDSVVTAIEPPRLIEYSWSGPAEPERPLRWEATPQDGGTQLVLTLRIPQTEDIARSAPAGKHTSRCWPRRSKACRSSFHSIASKRCARCTRHLSREPKQFL